MYDFWREHFNIMFFFFQNGYYVRIMSILQGPSSRACSVLWSAFFSLEKPGAKCVLVIYEAIVQQVSAAHCLCVLISFAVTSEFVSDKSQ